MGKGTFWGPLGTSGQDGAGASTETLPVRTGETAQQLRAWTALAGDLNSIQFPAHTLVSSQPLAIPASGGPD